jgi:hypothetical protein
MKRNLTALLALLLALVFPLPDALHKIAIRNRDAAAAESAPSQAVPQPPKASPAPPGFNQGGSQNDRPRSTPGMGGMSGMRGPAAASAAQAPLQSAQQAPQSYPQQPMASMGRPTEQGLTMREVLFVLSLQDALQVMTELLVIQEKLLSDPKAPEKESLRKELTRIKGQVRKISADYREVLSGQLRGD